MQDKINRILFLIILILLVLFGSVFIYNRYYGLKEFTKNVTYNNKIISISIYTTNTKKANNILNKIEKIYLKYEKLTNRYEKYEGINNLYYLYYNTDDLGNLTLDSELYNMIDFGKKWYGKSNGLIDISKGNIADIWQMYFDSKTGYPSKQELEIADTNSIDDIVLLNDNKIKNNHPNINLDMIKDGYIANVVKKYLDKNNISKYLINGGNIVLVGDNYKENGSYGIGLENPNNKNDIYKVIKGNNICVATTSWHDDYYEYNGKIYNYVINPKTLMPGTNVKSVSVISNDSAISNALSVTLFLMDVDEGKSLIESMDDVEAIWYTSNDEEIKSNGFDKYK